MPAGTLTFDRSHPGPYGLSIELSPLVRRVVANNPSPFTFTGTVTHIIGRGRVAILDPGPDDFDHIGALMAAIAGESVSHILVSHTHRDHVDGVEALRAVTAAPVWGCAPLNRPGAPSSSSESGADVGYAPDRELHDGDVVQGEGWTLEALATPGHTSNHLCFALAAEDSLFSGDHVMAWSTTVIAPPDGSMAAYRDSLRMLLQRGEDIYYPAHGPSLANAKQHVAALLAHRQAREAEILAAVASRPKSVREIADAVYVGLAPDLRGGAELSVLAHLQDLRERALVRIATEPGRTAYVKA